MPKEKTTLKTIAFRVTPEEWAFIDELNMARSCSTTETLREMITEFRWQAEFAKRNAE